MLELRLATVGVAAHLEAGLLQQFAGPDHAIEQVQVAAREQLLFNLSGQARSLVGAAAQYGTAGLTLAGRFLGSIQPESVLANGFFLLLDTLFVLRQNNALLDLLQLAVKVGQRIVEVLRCAVIALDLKVLPSYAQFEGRLQDLGDAAKGIAALGDTVQALPACQGNAQGQQQYQAKADTELSIDANVTQVLG
ncbi:hypothetical protein D3C77_557650 [compost metagenome]